MGVGGLSLPYRVQCTPWCTVLPPTPGAVPVTRVSKFLAALHNPWGSLGLSGSKNGSSLKKESEPLSLDSRIVDSVFLFLSYKTPLSISPAFHRSLRASSHTQPGPHMCACTPSLYAPSPHFPCSAHMSLPSLHSAGSGAPALGSGGSKGASTLTFWGVELSGGWEYQHTNARPAGLLRRARELA